MTRRPTPPMLTTTAQETYDAIAAITAEQGFTPTLRELGARLGLRSASSVMYRLDRLAECGAIVRHPGRARAIELHPVTRNQPAGQQAPKSVTPDSYRFAASGDDGSDDASGTGNQCRRGG